MEDKILAVNIPNNSLKELRRSYRSLKNVEMKDELEIDNDLAQAKGIYIALRKLGLENILSNTEEEVAELLLSEKIESRG